MSDWKVYMINIEQLLAEAIHNSASDIFLISNMPPTFKIDGMMVRTDVSPLDPNIIYNMICKIYELASNRSMSKIIVSGDDDFSFSVSSLGRMRVNILKQRGTYAAVIRIVRFELPDYKELLIPEEVMNLTNFKRGLVLITGPAGSGKSTTLSCLINKINNTESKHIITMEDPIEFIHSHNQSIVTQREINTDTESYIIALRAALRQSPDIIQLGEMRDLETIQVTMTAAETGQLLFSTLHTTGAANTIERIIDIFPEKQQHQIRIQLSMVLQAVVSQQLVPDINGKLIAVFEIMKVNIAIRNLIRESKVHQIDSAIFAGTNEGMCSMDTSLYTLYTNGRITKETTLIYSQNHDWMKRKLG